MPVFKIHHITKYEYTRTVKESNNAFIIYPINNEEQELLMHDFFPSTDVEKNGYPIPPIETAISSITTHISIDTSGFAA